MKPEGPELNEIGILKRREIEARIVAPLLQAFAAEFGDQRVYDIARRVIVEIAQGMGRRHAEHLGGNTLAHFRAGKEPWTKGGALELQVLEETESTYSFNVVRCKYAEMYRDLGIPELGALLSCGRDYAMSGGFNPNLKLERTQTIMQGAPYCDFRFRVEEAPPAPEGTRRVR